VAERHAGKADVEVRRGGAANEEAGLAGIIPIERGADQVGQVGDGGEQIARFGRFRVIAQRGDEFDRFAQQTQVLGELLGGGGVEHG